MENCRLLNAFAIMQMNRIQKNIFRSNRLSQHKPHSSYGPPAPVNHYLPPKVHTKYGPPKPHNTYGPPSTKPQLTYGSPSKPSISYIPAANHVPASAYGLPNKPAINFKPQQTYGVPSRPIRPPVSGYGPPSLLQSASNQLPPQSISQYGPPPNSQYGPPPSSQYGPPKNINGPLPVRCDGWKPIPGPSIQAVPNNIGSSIQSILPDNSYLPPSNGLVLADTHVEQSTNIGDDLQLPIAEAGNFLADNSLGLGITSFDVIKSNGIEVSAFHSHHKNKI